MTQKTAVVARNVRKHNAQVIIHAKELPNRVIGPESLNAIERLILKECEKEDKETKHLKERFAHVAKIGEVPPYRRFKFSEAILNKIAELEARVKQLKEGKE